MLRQLLVLLALCLTPCLLQTTPTATTTLVNQDTLPWTEALAHCMRLARSLKKVEKSDQNNCLQDLAKSTGVCGGTKDAKPPNKEKEFIYIKEKKLNWFQAYVDCRKRGLRLATIENEQEQKQLVELLKEEDKNQYNWLGGTNAAQSGTDWVWMSTGRPVNYTAWAKGEPNQWRNLGSNVYCMITAGNVRGNYWDDVKCSAHFNYICEADD